MIEKKELADYLKKSEWISVSGNFTGQVVLTFNFNQGGVTSIKRVVEDTIK